jgi:hypothetical protein
VVRRLGQAAVLQCLEAQRLQPVVQLGQLRRGALLAVGAQSVISQTLFLHFGLDAIQLADALDGLLCECAAAGLCDLDKLARHLHPAGELGDAVFEKGHVAGVIVDQERTAPIPEILAACLPLPLPLVP